jgi:hypothetical protein
VNTFKAYCENSTEKVGMLLCEVELNILIFFSKQVSTWLCFVLILISHFR